MSFWIAEPPAAWRRRCCTRWTADDDAGNGPCGSAARAPSAGKTTAASAAILRSPPSTASTRAVTARGGAPPPPRVSAAPRKAETSSESACACSSTKRSRRPSAARWKERAIELASKPSAAPPRPWGWSERFSSEASADVPDDAIRRQSPARSSTCSPSETAAAAAAHIAQRAEWSCDTTCFARASARVPRSSASGAERRRAAHRRRDGEFDGIGRRAELALGGGAVAERVDGGGEVGGHRLQLGVDRLHREYLGDAGGAREVGRRRGGVHLRDAAHHTRRPARSSSAATPSSCSRRRPTSIIPPVSSCSASTSIASSAALTAGAPAASGAAADSPSAAAP